MSYEFLINGIDGGVCIRMGRKMKAVQIYGPDAFEVTTIDRPVPKNNEVLVAIKSIAICGSDPKIFSGKSLCNGWPPYFPFVAGHEWAGIIEETGSEVIGFKTGDRVSGEAHCGCGTCEMCMRGYYNLCLNYRVKGSGHHHYGHYSPGCYAEYQVYDPRSLTILPDSVSFDEGALVDTAGTALNAIQLCGIRPGGFTVLIGPGPMGIMAMQIAKAMGSRTIVIGRRERLEVAHKMGADHVVDYEKVPDPVAEVMAITRNIGADQVIESAGSPDAFKQAVLMARKGGQVAFISIPATDDFQIPVKTLVMKQITLHGVRANPNCSRIVVDMIAQGSLNVKELITHTFEIDDIHEAFDTFVNRRDGAVKVVVHP